ncbi:MAG: hypothetical protein EOP04_14185 [Proteobacteria bacterium]|nr:MAG: hypothetical protein EOP04_14185 [Pseudomonadota bacterium]
MRSLNQTMITALARLPEPLRLELLENLKLQMNSVNLKDEVMSMQNGQLKMPLSRLYRRNIEMIASLLVQPYFHNLQKSLLHHSGDRNAFVREVDAHFAKTSKSLANGRGGYSFERVVESAEILQKSMQEHLTDSKDYIEMYGSFTNGKAAFVTSDIDIKFSSNLLTRITGKPAWQGHGGAVFSLFFEDFATREGPKMPPEFKRFWGNYQTAENLLGQNIFKRKPARPSELLTSLYPPKDYSNDAIDFRWYNPLVVRIYKDHIALQLVDINSSREILEITIPQR